MLRLGKLIRYPKTILNSNFFYCTSFSNDYGKYLGKKKNQNWKNEDEHFQLFQILRLFAQFDHKNFNLF